MALIRRTWHAIQRPLSITFTVISLALTIWAIATSASWLRWAAVALMVVVLVLVAEKVHQPEDDPGGLVRLHVGQALETAVDLQRQWSAVAETDLLRIVGLQESTELWFRELKDWMRQQLPEYSGTLMAPSTGVRFSSGCKDPTVTKFRGATETIVGNLQRIQEQLGPR